MSWKLVLVMVSGVILLAGCDRDFQSQSVQPQGTSMSMYPEGTSMSMYPEGTSMSMYPTEEGLNALESYFSVSRSRHVGSVVGNIITSGRGEHYFGHMSISSERVAAAGELHAKMNAYTALSTMSGERTNLLSDRGTAPGYQQFIENMSTSGTSMSEMIGTLVSTDPLQHMDLRNQLSEAGFDGRTWSELNSSEKGMVEEYIRENDTNEEGGWSNPSDDMMNTMLTDMTNLALDLEEMGTGDKDSDAVLNEIHEQRAGAEYNDITEEDITNYVAYSAAMSEGDTDNANALRQTMDTDTFQRLTDLSTELGTQFSIAEVEGAVLGRYWQNQIAGSMYGLGLEEGQEEELAQAFLRNDRETARNILEGLEADTGD